MDAIEWEESVEGGLLCHTFPLHGLNFSEELGSSLVRQIPIHG
jgi:hypothetical protein